MSNGAVVSKAMQMSRSIEALGVAERESLERAKAFPKYGNIMLYVNAVAKTGGRISIIPISTEVYLEHEDAIFTAVHDLKNQGFEVKATRRLISVTIPSKW